VVTRVCVSVCLYICVSVRGRMPALLHVPGCNLEEWQEMPLVVHYWADLQSGHGLRCYDNITATRNVSEYMLVLALCLVYSVLKRWSSSKWVILKCSQISIRQKISACERNFNGL